MGTCLIAERREIHIGRREALVNSFITNLVWRDKADKRNTSAQKSVFDGGEEVR